MTVMMSSSCPELADLVVEGDWDVPELFSLWHLSVTSSDSLTYLTWSSQDSSESVQFVLWCFCDIDSHYKYPFYWLELFILNMTSLITFVFGRRLEPNCMIYPLAINLDFNFSSSCSYITSPCGRLFLPAFYLSHSIFFSLFVSLSCMCFLTFLLVHAVSCYSMFFVCLWQVCACVYICVCVCALLC